MSSSRRVHEHLEALARRHRWSQAVREEVETLLRIHATGATLAAPETMDFSMLGEQGAPAERQAFSSGSGSADSLRSADHTLPPDADTAEVDASQLHADLSRYEDLGLLGEGGLAQVRRVYDRTLDRTVAMKILHESHHLTSAAFMGFREEARLTAQLDHPGIVPVHDAGRLPNGRLFFTMQVVRGETFRKVIRARHRQVSNVKLRYRLLLGSFVAICEALAYAHSQGVIHRDVKPGNVMIGPYGAVYVVDWGLARLSQSSSRVAGPTRPVGTPNYMPPEQARGEPDVGPAADIWALGATLLEVLRGEPPWPDLPRKQILAALVRGETPPMGERPAGAPEPLWELSARCLQVRPVDRPGSAGMLVDAVRDWLDGVAQEEQARGLVRQALAQAEEWEVLREEAASLREEAATRLKEVDIRAPISEKAPIWALEDRAKDLNRQIRLGEASYLQGLRAALSVAPELPEAHQTLADWYHARHVEAEVRGDEDEAAHLEVFLRDHDRAGRYASYLDGRGLLSLEADADGAAAELYRVEVQERRWVPVHQGPLGPLPLHGHRLDRGSWIVKVRAPGRKSVTYPVFIDRGRNWDATGERRIHLPSDRAVPGPETCEIPAGWFWSGGDPDVPSLPRRRLWVDAFTISRYPVTNAEFIAFLDGLVAAGREEEALRHVPRERAGVAGEQGPMIFGYEGGRFFLRPDEEGDEWLPGHPVVMVDWFAAQAYSEWLAAETGLPWRLPVEMEWEKAARGVDGRLYPWGDHPDATWMCIQPSHEGSASPPLVHEYPLDESPYGVRGMAGGVRDWCLDGQAEEGPTLDGDRVVVILRPQDTTARNYRGGDWWGQPIHARSAYRAWNKPGARNYSMGFRVARSVG